MFSAVKGMFPYIFLFPLTSDSHFTFGFGWLCVFYSHSYLLDAKGPICFDPFCDFYILQMFVSFPTCDLCPSDFAFWGNVTIILGYLAEIKTRICLNFTKYEWVSLVTLMWSDDKSRWYLTCRCLQVSCKGEIEECTSVHQYVWVVCVTWYHLKPYPISTLLYLNAEVEI